MIPYFLSFFFKFFNLQAVGTIYGTRREGVRYSYGTRRWCDIPVPYGAAWYHIPVPYGAAWYHIYTLVFVDWLDSDLILRILNPPTKFFKNAIFSLTAKGRAGSRLPKSSKKPITVKMSTIGYGP